MKNQDENSAVFHKEVKHPASKKGRKFQPLLLSSDKLNPEEINDLILFITG